MNYFACAGSKSGLGIRASHCLNAQHIPPIASQSADPYGFGVLEQAALVQLGATRALPKSGQEHTQSGHDL